MNRMLVGLAVVLSGCGGGDRTGPSHAFPAVAGNYNVQGGFNALPSNLASFTGTLTLTQASRDAAPLGGSSNITTTINGQVFNFANNLIDASVSPAGVITFTIADPTGSWTFTGTLAGSTITGQHSLTDGNQTLTGTWSATKAGGAVAAGATPAHALRDLVSAYYER